MDHASDTVCDDERLCIDRSQEPFGAHDKTRLQGLGQCNGSLVAYFVIADVQVLKRRIGLVNILCLHHGVAKI